MPREAGGFRGGDVFFHAVAADGDAGSGLGLFQMPHDVQAAAVGEADVADEQVERVLAGLAGGAYAISNLRTRIQARKAPKNQ